MNIASNTKYVISLSLLILFSPAGSAVTSSNFAPSAEQLKELLPPAIGVNKVDVTDVTHVKHRDNLRLPDQALSNSVVPNKTPENIKTLRSPKQSFSLLQSTEAVCNDNAFVTSGKALLDEIKQ